MKKTQLTTFNKVMAATSVPARVAALIQTVAGWVKRNADNPAKLAELSADLNANSNTWADAVEVNTPAAVAPLDGRLAAAPPAGSEAAASSRTAKPAPKGKPAPPAAKLPKKDKPTKKVNGAAPAPIVAAKAQASRAARQPAKAA